MTAERVNVSKLTALAQVESGGKRLRLLVDAPKLHAYLELTPVARAFEVRLKEIEEMIGEKGILLAADRRAQLEKFVAELNDPAFDPAVLDGADPILIAEGMPAKDGEDGRLDWNIDINEPGTVKLKTDAKGNVDFREMNTVVNVREHDLLFTEIEPRRCEPGVDVFGNAIQGYDGLKAQYQRGKGVLISSNGKEASAEIDGHVRWDGRALSVEPVYALSGCVDFQVGNIDFNGSVEVAKDVLDGFVIKARDNIKVGGVAGQSSLHAGGNVEIHGGINGGTDSLIEAKNGTVYAKYLNNARIDAGGDVVIQTRVNNARINCRGRIQIPTGSVVGGHLVALSGMVIGTAGVKAGTKTVLEMSLDAFENETVREVDAEIAKKSEALEKIKPRLAPLLADPKKLKGMKPEQIEGIRRLSLQMKELENALAEARKRKDDTLREFAESLGEEIVIRTEIHPGTEVIIDDCRTIFNQRISGPIALRANYTDSSIGIHIAGP